MQFVLAPADDALMKHASVLRLLLISSVFSLVLSCAAAGTASADLTRLAAGTDSDVALSVSGDYLYWSLIRKKAKSPKSVINRTYLPTMTSAPVLRLKDGTSITRLHSGSTRIAFEVGQKLRTGKRSIYAERSSVFNYDLANSALTKLAEGTYYFDYKHLKACGTYPSLMGVFADEPLYTKSRTRRSGGACKTGNTRSDFYSAPAASVIDPSAKPRKIASIRENVYSAGRSGNQLVYATGDAVRAKELGKESRILLAATAAQIPTVEMDGSGLTVAALLHIGKKGYVDRVEDPHLFEIGAYNAPGFKVNSSDRVTPCGDRVVTSDPLHVSDQLFVERHATDGFHNIDVVDLPEEASVVGVTCTPKWLAFAIILAGGRTVEIYATDYDYF